MNSDRLTRWTAVAAVLAVAAVAAWISYKHAVAVVTAHGETGAVGRAYPVCIDGLIIAASMVLLDAARHREDAPRLAWWMLGAGIVATLAVNVLAGTASGWLGAVIAAWPAGAFVGAYEVLMLLVRAAARREPSPAPSPFPVTTEALTVTATETPVTVPEPVTLRAALNGHAAEAEHVFAADITEGRVPGIRRIMTGLHVGDDRARLVQTHLRNLTEK